MPQSKAKIPRIDVPGRLASFSLTDAQWLSVERAYGHSLGSTVRDQITDATNRYLWFAGAETGTMEDAFKRIRTLQEAGRVLLDRINNNPVSGIVKRYVDDEIGLWGPAEHVLNYVPKFSIELMSFLEACEKAAKSMEGAAEHYYWKDGWAWQAWIDQLVFIFTKHSLLVSARQDTDKTKDQSDSSSFVRLVKELQLLLPDQARSTYSVGALAQAINKARRRTIPPLRSRAVSKQRRPAQ